MEQDIKKIKADIQKGHKSDPDAADKHDGSAGKRAAHGEESFRRDLEVLSTRLD